MSIETSFVFENLISQIAEDLMLDRASFAARLDQIMDEEAAMFLETVPKASHLTDDQPLDTAYYVRHRIETVKRIRLTAKTDAIALTRMVDEDYAAARPWGRYVCEELEHDVMYLSDLAKHGVTEAVVFSTPLFPATEATMAYLTRRIDEIGSLPAVTYSLFVEWNSARYSQPAVQKAARTFSQDHVAGSALHLGIDETEDHYEVMVDIAHRLLARQKDQNIVFEMIGDFAALFRRYFTELHQETQAGSLAA